VPLENFEFTASKICGALKIGVLILNYSLLIYIYIYNPVDQVSSTVGRALTLHNKSPRAYLQGFNVTFLEAFNSKVYKNISHHVQVFFNRVFLGKFLTRHIFGVGPPKVNGIYITAVMHE
jgi:hypothetical protein